MRRWGAGPNLYVDIGMSGTEQPTTEPMQAPVITLSTGRCIPSSSWNCEGGVIPICNAVKIPHNVQLGALIKPTTIHNGIFTPSLTSR